MVDDDDDDLHDQLARAFLEYFKANEVFIRRPSVAKRVAARKWLTTIMLLAKDRRQEILDSHRHKSEKKFIKKKNIKKKAP
jgi:hypothetical protein|tara:strand:+ start:1037 stop:1279 length:243 start_codon:yes stop_codon:yes gene_type:complete